MNRTAGGGDLWQMTDAEGRGGIDGMHHWWGETEALRIGGL
jgi:hypothetical protein